MAGERPDVLARNPLRARAGADQPDRGRHAGSSCPSSRSSVGGRNAQTPALRERLAPAMASISDGLPAATSRAVDVVRSRHRLDHLPLHGRARSTPSATRDRTRLVDGRQRESTASRRRRAAPERRWVDRRHRGERRQAGRLLPEHWPHRRQRFGFEPRRLQETDDLGKLIRPQPLRRDRDERCRGRLHDRHGGPPVGLETSDAAGNDTRAEPGTDRLHVLETIEARAPPRPARTRRGDARGPRQGRRQQYVILSRADVT